METSVISRGSADYPIEVEKRMHKQPAELYVRGASLSELMQRPRVAIVGTRRITPYGKRVTQQFARSLAEQGVVVVSGLAYGVDACAHQAALHAGGQVIAVLPSPVEAPVPTANLGLARQIVNGGGALVSTYPVGSENHKGNFVARNELVAALSDVILVTEATTDSGTRHTVKFADGMPGVHVMAVPGNIDQPTSAGPNNWISNDKAKLAPNPQAVLKELGLKTTMPLPLHLGDTPEEQALIDLLAAGVSDGQQLLERSRLSVQIYNQTLTMLEINGVLQPLGGNHWGLT